MKKEEGMVNFVDCINRQVSELAKYLQVDKGFVLASCVSRELEKGELGRLSDEGETKVLGVIDPHQTIQERRRFFSFFPKSRRVHFMNIWFKPGPSEAGTEHWVCDIFGRNNISLAESLANEMAAVFRVKVSIRLLSENPKLENLPSDFSGITG